MHNNENKTHNTVLNSTLHASLSIHKQSKAHNMQLKQSKKTKTNSNQISFKYNNDSSKACIFQQPLATLQQ